MLKTILVLPDGTELSSGVGAVNAISNVTVTEMVNDSQELTLGSCCCNMLEAVIIAPGGGLSIAAGEELTAYRVDEAGARHKVGLFTAEKPTRSTANTLKITAYDRVSRLDKDLTSWLAGLEEWPYSLGDLAYKVCQACGLSFISDQIPNGSYPVQRFSADGITGRQLMKWIGQIAGCFCRATPDGEIELGWYEPLSSVTYNNGHLNLASGDISVEDDGTGKGRLVSDTLEITDDGNGNITLAVPAEVEGLYYYQNGLSAEDYTVAPIQKVQLRQNEEDVGTVYPDGEGEVNTYIITGNPLLTANTAQDLKGVAQTIYERLQGVTYTPCSLSVPANMAIRAGKILCLTDHNGKSITAYVMSRRQAGQRDKLECTGSPRRDSTTVLNNQSFNALTGKVLNLRTDVEGLKAENADTEGRLAKIQLDVESISSEVSRQQETVDWVQKELTAVKQTAEGLSIQVQSIVDDGVSRVVSGLGLTISRPDSDMTNTLDETGMFVIRDKGTGNEEVMLQADTNGVIATDVTVRNYLVIGNFARFEDYRNGTDGKRTACYFIGGG